MWYIASNLCLEGRELMPENREFVEIKTRSDLIEVKRIIDDSYNDANKREEAFLLDEEVEFFEIFLCGLDDDENVAFLAKILNALTNDFLIADRALVNAQRRPLPKSLKARNRMTEKRDLLTDKRSEVSRKLHRAIFLLVRQSFAVSFDENKYLVTH